MTRKAYLKDRIVPLCIEGMTAGLIFIFLQAFHVSAALLSCVLVIFLLGVASAHIFEYRRRAPFYRVMLENAARLDKKNLLSETLPEASFYEGHLLTEILCDMGKSMTEQISTERRHVREFQEFIELWVHEMKLPLSSMTLQLHNRSEIDAASLRRADEIVEEVLYYTRSETPEKDFLIKELPLRKIVVETAQKYRKDLQAAEITLSVNVGDETVFTDGKWLLFCLGQLFSNAMKYRKSDADEASEIRITAEDDEQKTVLTVWDNGIGIKESDIPYVTEKSFTGENGRLQKSATGMGLYIVNRLCKKLGHTLRIKSRQGEYTAVSIAFFKNTFLSFSK